MCSFLQTQSPLLFLNIIKNKTKMLHLEQICLVFNY